MSAPTNALGDNRENVMALNHESGSEWIDPSTQKIPRLSNGMTCRVGSFGDDDRCLQSHGCQQRQDIHRVHKGKDRVRLAFSDSRSKRKQSFPVVGNPLKWVPG